MIRKMVEFDVLSLIPWVIPFAFAVFLYIKKDSFKRGESEASMEGKNLLTSTLLTNAIKQLETQSNKLDKITEAQQRLNNSIIDDLHEIKTEQAVMSEKLKTIRQKVFGYDYNREQDEEDKERASRRREREQ